MPTSTVGRSISLGRSGFTLFELIVVIAILATITGLVVPNINLDFGQSGIGKAVEIVQSALDQGRTQARLRRTDVAVSFGGKTISVGDEKTIKLPAKTSFMSILFAGDDERIGSKLIIDRRGIVPASIIRMKVDDEVYSLMVSPVLRDISVRKGLTSFSDYTE